ncbi:MAG: hypothetical protein WED33_10130 [Bacteroidia bacterium]
MNSFYAKHRLLQWFIAIVMIVIAMLMLGLWVHLIEQHFLAYLLVFFWVPLFQFLTTPIFTLAGAYKYVSPMLLVYMPNEQKYDLHNGTSFDYLIRDRKSEIGMTWRNKLLYYYIEGLLEIIQKVENDSLPKSLVIRGSSYFFSRSTAERLGFSLEKAGAFEKVNLVMNYLDLFWMYSVSKGKLSFPSLRNTKTAKILAGDLVKSKPKLQAIKEYLKKS